MKSFYKSLKRQDGFTLVELMVVVAIIGLLSAVAIPNFKKYQSKAKMSEAKLQLSAAYMSQQSFFSDFNLYANCLRYMGYDPVAERAARYYAIGFKAAAANPATASTGWQSAIASGLDNTATVGCLGGAPGGVDAVSFFSAGKGVGNASIGTIGDFTTGASAALAGTLGTQTIAGTFIFNIAAVGIISQDFPTAATSSSMSVSQAKVFTTTRNGY